MYTDFFGFKERPFNVTPDPDFIYYSDQHKEALAHMLYGVQDRKGFILITGRVGSGKTTLCRAFLRELEPTTSTALVLNTTMDSLELLKTIADDLGLDLPENAGVKKIVDAINKFVLEEYREGRNVCVIIDEAQNLSTEVLEHLRLLSNLETNKEKLLQMILVGQPELNNLLNRKQLRQLKQRITVRSFLSNLSQEETREYVLHRMNQAEPARPIQLDSKIFPRLYKASGGNPRAINLICDRLLMAAFVDETFSITCRHLRRALVDLADETENPENARVLHRLKRMDPGSWKNMDTVDFLTRTAVVAAVTFIFIITAAWLGGFFDSQTEIQVSRQLAESKLPVEKEKPQSEADPVADPVRQSTGDTEPNAESDSPANKFNVKPLSTRKGDTSLLGVVSLARYLSYVYQGDSEEINWPGKKRINYDLQLQDLIPEVLDVTMVKIGPEIDDPLYYEFPALLRFNSSEGGERYILYIPQEDSFWDPLQGWVNPRRGIFSRADKERGWLLVQAEIDPNEIYGQGKSGPEVVALQKLLNKAGDYNIPLEYAHYGEMTEEAISDFQEKNYLYVDGMSGAQTNLYLLKEAGRGMPEFSSDEIKKVIERVTVSNVTD